MWWIIGILSIPYGLKMLKKDINNTKTDFNTTVTDNEKMNKRRVRENFNEICKSVGIKLDKKKRPVKKKSMQIRC